MQEKQISGVTLLAVVSTLVLAGCSSSGSDQSDDSADSPTSRYEQALAHLPAETTTFEFRDVAAAESRLGIESEHDPEAYLDAISEDGWAPSVLLPFLAVMSDSTWDATDIVWEAQTFASSDPLTVRRLDDDVDLDAAVDEFEDAGYSSENASGGTLLTAGLDDLAPDDSARYVELGLAALVLPGEHLIISAPNEGALSAYTGIGDSLADTGTFDDLAGSGDGLEYLYAQTGSTACNPVANPTDVGTDSAGAAKALSPYEDLETPAAATLTIAAATNDTTATVRLAFDDAATAESDLDARTGLLKEGTSLVTGEPFSTYLTVADATVSGSIETIEVDAEGVPGRLVDMVRQRDTPFLACAPV